MARRAAQVCKRPQCPGLVRAGVCSVCGPLRRVDNYDRQRPSAARRGYDARWRRLRLMFLRAHPLCEICEEAGLVVAATDVHHKLAKRDGGKDEWDNLQALCHSCHSRITNAETARGGDG